MNKMVPPVHLDDLCILAHLFYSEFMMKAMASQITGVWVLYSAFCSGTDQNLQSSTVLSFGGEYTGDRWISGTKGQ